MAKCRNCGKSYNVLTADLGSGLCPECKAAADEAARNGPGKKKGASFGQIAATVFSIVDALVVLWFVLKAGNVLENAGKLASEQAVSAMQASQV